MLSPRHQAVAAGLALSLTFAAAAVPQVAAAADTRAVTEADGTLFEEGSQGLVESVASLFSARTSSLTAVSLSDEMKYFTAFESGKNYDQGLSAGDGYNALGYYQFDRRYSLIPSIEEVYAYNPTKYAMFAGVLNRASEIKNAGTSLYDSSAKSLTATGTLLNDAWHAAYRADAAEFSALQDSYAYNTYYKPVESILLSRYGVDLSGRADALKGLAWGMGNLFGTGGVQSFFDWAKADSGLSNDMSDREIALALTNAVIDHIKEYAPKQSQYWQGWINRYKREQQIVLGYIAEDEQAAAESGAGSGTPSGDTGSNANSASEGSSGADDSTTAAGSDAGEASTSSGAPAGGVIKDSDASGLASGSSDAAAGAGDETVNDSTADAHAGSESNGEDSSGDSAGENAAGSGADTSTTGDTGENQENDGQSAGDTTGAAQMGGSGDTAIGSDDDSAKTPATHTVTFTSKGAVVDSVKVVDGQTVSASAAATQFSGYSFVGWYLNGAPFDFSTPITADTELVAYYRKGVQETSAERDTASPKALPQTGDNGTLIALAAAGTAAVGASAVALGAVRRREKNGA
ncbi:InlB B-repeat-containing protein [Collinsella vaginalis]|uniref:InlB B-repeat-containing protein n=1 Tax=Collinsella vaginalis TaxID=1870987 RepID=UPI000A26D361|nr:InlB B-repeat-containing protein [Collinsella vaginalis]